MILLSTAPAPAAARGVQYFLRWRNIQALLATIIFLNLFVFLPRRNPGTQLAPQVVKEESLPPQLVASEALQRIGRVFITSLLKDSEGILKAGWSDAVVNLTRVLGPENVWVSIHESGSRDDTEKELRILQSRLQELGAGHSINMAEVDEDMHAMLPQDGPGWIQAEGKHVLRRIPWLAELRNLNIKHLTKLENQNATFDKVLFLNDIVFTADDALELLGTRDGHYAAACGFDFSRPWPTISFYDQFATRDIDGQELESLYHPYFAQGDSQAALLRGLPVPVKSCWSGIAAFDARPFQHPKDPLRFRSINDSLAEYSVEASECCLIHYDNPMSLSEGVWMNPNVRVAYKASAYEAVHRPSGWPSAAEIRLGHISALWTRLVRLNDRRRASLLRIHDDWAQTSMSTEVGKECLVHKMMVVSDEGKWSEI